MGQKEAFSTFVEAANVTPVFLSGLAHVHADAFGLLHFALFQEQQAGDGSTERVIVCRAIMPEAAWLALRDAAEHEIAAAGRPVPKSRSLRPGVC